MTVAMSSEPARALLGTITAPSGTVLLIDGGMLPFWSHDESPLIEAGQIGDAEIEEGLNTAKDFRIVGPDAIAAGRALAFQWHPEFLYDIPPNHVADVRQRFQSIVSEHHLDARLVPLDRRIPHNERARMAVSFGRGAGEVYYQRLFATAFGNLPTDRPLPLYGTRMADEAWADYWRWIDLEVDPTRQAVRTEEVGFVTVDCARLLFGDLAALQQWTADESLDGKADFLFWGVDAKQVARKFDTPITGTVFGWRDLPIDEAIRLGLAVEDERAQQQLRFATDFRPHSHHYLMMEQVRASDTGAGVLNLADATICLFVTSWGDGAFSIYRDVADDGDTVRIRIDLGNDERVQRMQALQKEWG